MVEWFLKIDYWLFEKINHSGAFNFGDSFFPWVTDLHKLTIFIFIVVPLILFFYYRKYKKLGLVLFLNLIIALSCNDFVGAQVKNHYLRLRPFENKEITAIQKSPAGAKSFYSNHTSNMFTFATYTSQFIPEIKIPLFLFAAIVGYSRIYNGVHYPSDVFVGALAGLFWGLTFAYFSRKIIKNYFPKSESKQ
jgi:undecaprenyl-diphosphatase